MLERWARRPNGAYVGVSPPHRVGCLTPAENRSRRAEFGPHLLSGHRPRPVPLNPVRASRAVRRAALGNVRRACCGGRSRVRSVPGGIEALRGVLRACEWPARRIDQAVSGSPGGRRPRSQSQVAVALGAADLGVVDEPVDHGGGDGLVAEDVGLAFRLIAILRCESRLVLPSHSVGVRVLRARREMAMRLLWECGGGAASRLSTTARPSGGRSTCRAIVAAGTRGARSPADLAGLSIAFVALDGRPREPAARRGPSRPRPSRCASSF